MKITLHSEYDHFTISKQPKYIEWTNKPTGLDCYVNEYVKTVSTPPEQSIALLIEPRSLYGEVYDWMNENANKFKYVFTHDNELLKLPNAKKILFGGVWASDPKEKTKNISMISSNKHLCPLHDVRYNLCRQLENKIDCYGWNGHRIDTISAHAPYRFAVVIENYIDDYWFTEKICNCFANKTIPIYYGARKIGKYFNLDGIIQAVPEEIPALIEILNCEKTYKEHLWAVEDNYKRVKDYYCFEDWFYNEYKGVLDGIINHS